MYPDIFWKEMIIMLSAPLLLFALKPDHLHPTPRKPIFSAPFVIVEVGIFDKQ